MKCFKVIKEQDNFYCMHRNAKMFKVEYSRQLIDKNQVDFVKIQNKEKSLVVGIFAGVTASAAFIYLLGQLFADTIVNGIFDSF